MAESLGEIFSIFKSLERKDSQLKSMFEDYSIQYSEEIANTCAQISRSVNKVLKLYPKITDMGDKVKIKAQLKFYYNLMSNLMHFIRSIENFQRIGDEYFDNMLDFLDNKYTLINGKYTEIVKYELHMFYNKGVRDRIEHFLEKRLNDQYKPKKI